ncbi:MAG: DUF5677 domain-containing protein, partial [Hyphomicrobium sp.]
ADGLAMAKLASIVELAHCFRFVVANEKNAAALPIFRTLLDHYVDLKNLCTDDLYHKHFYARHHVEWINRLEAARNGNPALSLIASSEDFDQSLADHRASLAALEAKGHNKLTEKERFRRAEMQSEFESIYSFTSTASHGGLGDLLNRNFKSSGESYELHLFKEVPEDFFSNYLYLSCELLLNGLELMSARAHIDCRSRIAAFRVSLTEFS